MSFHRRYALRGFFGGSGGEELPSAEESVFGEVETTTEYGFEEPTFSSFGNSTGKQVYGWRFKAAESFKITQIRVYSKFYSNTLRVGIWDENGVILREGTITRTAGDRWYVITLSDPLVVAAGKSYTVSSTAGDQVPLAPTPSLTFNGKLLNVEWVYSEDASFPTTISGTWFHPINIVMEPVSVELPNTYQVERTTMDDIANEVIRISGTGSKMTTEQILTALKAVSV